MKQEDEVRVRRDAYREQATDCVREALVTGPGSAAHARAVREGLLCADRDVALSWVLDEPTDDNPCSPS